MKIKKISQNNENKNNEENNENNENKNYTVRSMLNDLKKWGKILKNIN
jgi:hypothetical protein